MMNRIQIGKVSQALADPYGDLVAFDPSNGRVLWHSRLAEAQKGNAPQTYLVDGKQYLLVTAGDSVFSFKLQQ